MDIYSFAYASHALPTGNCYHQRAYIFARNLSEAEREAKCLMRQWCNNAWMFDNFRDLRLETERLPALTWIHGNQLGSNPLYSGAHYCDIADT